MPPCLVSRLLILQRQGEFEKKTTASEIRSAAVSGNTLQFEFATPLPGLQEVRRVTSVKAFFILIMAIYDPVQVRRVTSVKAVFNPASQKYPAGRLDAVWVRILPIHSFHTHNDNI